MKLSPGSVLCKGGSGKAVDRCSDREAYLLKVDRMQSSRELRGVGRDALEMIKDSKVICC